MILYLYVHGFKRFKVVSSGYVDNGSCIYASKFESYCVSTLFLVVIITVCPNHFSQLRGLPFAKLVKRSK